jgi:hypothetical protein
MNKPAKLESFQGPETEAEDVALRTFDKVGEFQLEIQGGLLDNLGIKMYTKLGKVLVEFAANAYIPTRLPSTSDSTSRRSHKLAKPSARPLGPG